MYNVVLRPLVHSLQSQEDTVYTYSCSRLYLVFFTTGIVGVHWAMLNLGWRQ